LGPGLRKRKENIGIDTPIYIRTSHGADEGAPGRADTFRKSASRRKKMSKIEADRTHFNLTRLGLESSWMKFGTSIVRVKELRSSEESA